MNSRGNQAVAVLVAVVLFVFAWDLGRKQALNSLLARESSASVSTAPGVIDADRSSNDANVKSPEKTYTASPVIAGGESVEVEDQRAGMEVKVSSLALSEMGWVGVRDSDGRVLGAGRFEAGSYKNVAVPLLRATVAGDAYQVLLYADDGDREFDLHKDILITDTNDDVGGTNFKAL